jgi:hypothetical protein
MAVVCICASNRMKSFISKRKWDPFCSTPDGAGSLKILSSPDMPVALVADIPTPLRSQESTDSILLALVQGGDEYAMACLYDSYSRIVYSVALRVLRDPSAAEDVLQDVFLRIWRSPSSFAPARGSIAGWLAIISRNRSIDVLRKRRPMDSVDDLPLQSPINVFNEVEGTVTT